MGKQQYILLTLLIVLMCSSCATSKKEEYTRLEGFVFGTTYHITYKSTVNYEEPINTIFKKFNNSLSTYIPNSIISKINKGDTTVVVDDYFVEAFDKAKRIYVETDGYFDPTIGKLIDAYGFGSGKEQKNLTEEEIEELMKSKGFDEIILKDRRIQKPNNIEFNVNAFAKGLGIDVVGRFLEDNKIQDYLVEIGGEIRAKGKSPRGKLWKVAIDDPNTDGTRSASKFITLDNQSMATSGNYRKFKINTKGEKIVHTVNPKTGLAQESKLLSVSVASTKDCADVDAYATAFLAMGLEKTKNFIAKKPSLKVVLLYAEEGGIKEFSN